MKMDKPTRFKTGYIHKSWNRKVVVVICISTIIALCIGITLPLCMKNGCWSEVEVEEEPRPSTSTVLTPTSLPITEATTTTTPSATSTTTTRRVTLPVTTTSSSSSSSSTKSPIALRNVTVGTKYGPITGHYVEVRGTSGEKKTLVSYLGVPYAKPPSGSLRWKRPQPPEAWSAPLVADELQSLCPQNNLSVQVTHQGWDKFSEDCLYMNIYTPAETGKEPFPVMFFIHGGVYVLWGNILFPGHFLAEKDVVVVSINYRLGILGFLSTNETETHSNFGLWDQLMALEWVRDNIRSFGGDPDRVTVFGESVGAASTGLMMVSPQTEGLFHQAILESGSELHHWAVNGPAYQQETYIYDVAEQLDCPTQDNEDMLDCMRNIDVKTLRATSPNFSHYRGFRPVVDGENGYIPKMPRELRREGLVKNISIMIGTNQNESNIMILGDDPTLLFRDLNRTQFETGVRRVIASLDFAISDQKGEENLFHALNWFYSPWPLLDDDRTNKEALCKLQTDKDFVAGTAEVVARHTGSGQPVFQYLLDVHYSLLVGGNILPEWFGVPHMWDLPYIFGYPQIQFSDEEVKKDTGYLNIPAIRFSRKDEEWSEFIITLWTNFAKYGNPTPGEVLPPDSQIPLVWTSAEPKEDNFLYLENTKTGMKTNFKSLESSFWNNYFNYVAKGEDIHNDISGYKSVTLKATENERNFGQTEIENLFALVDKLMNTH